MGNSINVLYFAWLREKVGAGSESLPLPAEIATVGKLIDHLAGRGPGYEAAFARRSSIRCAVNQEFAGFDHPIAPNDEVAFFPPVTGG